MLIFLGCPVTPKFQAKMTSCQLSQLQVKHLILKRRIGKDQTVCLTPMASGGTKVSQSASGG